MKNKSVHRIINNPLYLSLLIVGLLLLGFIIFLILQRKESSGQPQIKEGQIQIVKGEEVITINQNGLVEYKSKDKTYTETWDASQISSFFSMMEQKARDYLARRVSGGDCGYKVFMFIDRKLVSICIDLNDQDLADTVEPIFIKYSDVNLTDYFDDGSGGEEGSEDGEFNGTITFPTSTPSITQITPTPTPYPPSSQNTNYSPVESGCDAWSADIVRNRAIISNTYCTVNLTPTPVP